MRVLLRIWPAAALALLAAACAPTPRPDAGTFPQALSGLGTEPFWGVRIEGTTVSYTNPQTPTPHSTTVTRREASGRLELAGTLDGRSLRITVAPQACSDGMSDRTYPFTLTLALGEQMLEGCAYPTGMPLPPA